MDPVPYLDPLAMPLDAAFPPSPKAFQRGSDVDAVRSLIAGKQWRVTGPAYTEACRAFAQFASKCQAVFTAAMQGEMLPFPPLRDGGPSILPVLHTVAPNLEGWSPFGGRWQVGIHQDGRFLEIRFDVVKKTWEERPLKGLFVPPSAVVSALHRAISEAVKSKEVLEANSKQIATECRQACALLDTVARQQQPQ